MLDSRAVALAALVVAALGDAGACSFPSGYEVAEPVAPWIEREGEVPEEPKVKVLPLVRGYDDGHPGSCSDAGILTILLPGGKPEGVAYYWFKVVKGEFPDLAVPDAKLLPVEIGDDQVGFRFVWLDLPYGQRHLKAFDVTIEIRAISNRGVVGEAEVVKLSHPGGMPANKALRTGKGNPARLLRSQKARRVAFAAELGR